MALTALYWMTKKLHRRKSPEGSTQNLELKTDECTELEENQYGDTGEKEMGVITQLGKNKCISRSDETGSETLPQKQERNFREKLKAKKLKQRLTCILKKGVKIAKKSKSPKSLAPLRKGFPEPSIPPTAEFLEYQREKHASIRKKMKFSPKLEVILEVEENADELKMPSLPNLEELRTNSSSIGRQIIQPNSSFGSVEMLSEGSEISERFLYADLGNARDVKLVDPRTIDLLEKQFGYMDPELLGKGKFGTVIKFKRPQEKGDIAVKCIAPGDVKQGERKLWKRLRHPNIVTLLNVNVCSQLNLVFFEMIAYPKNLMIAVRLDKFIKSAEALQQLKAWLYQVLCGLDFLHQRQLCHLDLKADNILISRQKSRAMIGDFSFLSQKSSKIRRKDIGLPRVYQPPETSRVLKKGETVDGRRFDLWSFGIMSFELLTHFHMLRSNSCCYLGTDGRYGSMKKALQADTFLKKMQNALPAVKINTDDVKMALDFVHSFIRTDPPSRLTAEQGMQHKFLGKGHVMNAKVDELWENPDATIQSILEIALLLSSKHQIQGRGVKNWLQHRWFTLRRLFK